MINETVLDKTKQTSGWQRLLVNQWRKSLGAWTVLAFTALTFVFILYQIFEWGDKKQISVTADLFQAVISVALVFLTWRVVRHPAIDSASRRAWLLVTFAYLANSIGNWVWFYLSSILQVEAFPSTADYAFWAFYPFMFWALFLFPTAETMNRSERFKFVMDVAITTLGGAMTVWSLVIRPTIEKSAEGDALMTFLNLSYVVADLIMLLGIATILLRRPARQNRVALFAVVFGLFNNLFADVGFTYFTLQGTYESGHWIDNFYISAMLVFLVASHFQYQYLSQTETEEEDQRDEIKTQSFSWLPYLAVGVGMSILLIETLPFWTEWLGIVIFASIGLTALVVFRQIVAVKENLRLLEEQTARKSELYFHALIKDSSDITGIFTVDGAVKFISPSISSILGYSATESLGMNSFDFVHPEDVETLKGAFQKAAVDHEYVFRNEYRYKHRDGSWRILEGIGKAFKDPDGNFAGILQNFRDITDRKKAENQLRGFTAKLQQSNRELQDFANIASHDLQEPLRKVQAFGDRLNRKYADALGEEGSDYIRRMRESAGRMQNLINDLLAFSRVTSKAKPFEKVDLNRIVAEVVSDLEIRIEQTGGRIETGALPVIDADPVQMRQLLQNLIGNALKFHRAGVPPLIRVTAEDVAPVKGKNEGQMIRLAVEDNGIGFDEKYLDRIFTVFQRLHQREDYEGSGIGLAVCRKIVERHNGHITATSIPEKGSSFYVVLPINQMTEELINESIS